MALLGSRGANLSDVYAAHATSYSLRPQTLGPLKRSSCWPGPGRSEPTTPG